MAQNQILETQIRAGVSIVDKTSAHTLELADNGVCISTDSNITIPANASVAFRKGSMTTIYNANATSNITISITSDTLRVAGASNTGTQNLKSYGVATLFKVGATEWVASGAGYADV